MSESENETGYALPIGTLDEARAMIGKRTPLRWAPAEVSLGRIQQFCAMVQDGNPSYWEGGIAPPAMLWAWVMPLEWSPSSAEPQPGLPARIPLPGRSMVNGGNDTTYQRSVRVGDRLSIEEELLSVSDLKQTRLGEGHFVETLSVFRNQDGDVVAEVRNTLFRFEPSKGS